MTAILATTRVLILERSRQTSFYVFLLVLIIFFFLPFPASVRFDSARGLSTSGYLGAYTSWRSLWLFALMGFFITRASVHKDRQSGIAEILTSTPLKKITYLAGKLMGCMVFLGILLSVVYFLAAAAQIIHGEAPLQPLKLLWPFVLFTLPAIAFVSGAGLFSTVVPIVKGWPGDVVFVFYLLLGKYDAISGYSLWSKSIRRYLDSHPEAIYGIGANRVFFWPGMALSWDVIRPRLTWMLAGLTLAVIAIPLFDRFPHDSSQRWWPLHKIITSRTPATLSTSFAPTASLPDSTAAAQGWKLPFTALLVEIHLTLKRRWWYWLGCSITLVASLFVSQQDLKLYLLPLALILPTGIIADIGCREAKKDTDEMILTAPYIQKWYPIWKWAAGLIVSILPLLGSLAASTVSGQLSSAAALCVGIGFLVSLAVFSSVWTGDHRPFIILYTFLWWLMMNGIDKNPPRLLDWSGLWHEGRFPMVVGTYLLLTMLLIGLSLIPHRWNTFRK